MNEQQIEMHVEKAMTRLDKALMCGAYTQAQYDDEVRFLDKWASDQYKHLQMELEPFTSCDRALDY